MADIEIGQVIHYFSRAGVAGIKLTATLRQGDTIHIVGHTTDLTQPVESMQLENQSIPEAQPGQEIGIRIKDRVRPGDRVYKVE